MQSIKNKLNSATLLVMGVVFLYVSQSVFFTFGGKGRYLSLILGMLLILGATVLRVSHRRAVSLIPFCFISCVYFSTLLLLSFIQQHQILDFLGVVFQLVCFTLFVCGYLLARLGTPNEVWRDSWVQLLLSGLSLLVLYRFLDYVKMISFFGSERGFGESELNPVGAAYSSMIVALTFLYMFLFSCSFPCSLPCSCSYA